MRARKDRVLNAVQGPDNRPAGALLPLAPVWSEIRPEWAPFAGLNDSPATCGFLFGIILILADLAGLEMPLDQQNSLDIGPESNSGLQEKWGMC